MTEQLQSLREELIDLIFETKIDQRPGAVVGKNFEVVALTALLRVAADRPSGYLAFYVKNALYVTPKHLVFDKEVYAGMLAEKADERAARKNLPWFFQKYKGRKRSPQDIQKLVTAFTHTGAEFEEPDVQALYQEYHQTEQQYKADNPGCELCDLNVIQRNFTEKLIHLLNHLDNACPTCTHD